ncbi:MAG: YncE family protein [Sphingomonadales bacterium]
MRIISGVFFLTVFIFACRKEIPLPETVNAGSSSVLVLNEGNFMWSNASVDLYNLDSGLLKSNVYQQVNGKPLGDVLQSGSIINGDIWLVLNNTGKISVLDSHTLKEKYSIASLGSPRYALRVENQVWITDLWSGTLQVRDLTGNQLMAKLHTGSWTEQMVNTGGKVWVACYDGWIRKYDAVHLRKADSVYIGKGLRWMVKDKNSHVWALASFNDSGFSRLQQWSSDGKKMKDFTMPLSGYASSLCINDGGDTLYYLSNGVYSMGIDELKLPVTPIYKRSGANFYHIAYHPSRNLIFLCDAADYVSKGTVYILNSSGAEISKFKAGIIPSGFVFY